MQRTQLRGFVRSASRWLRPPTSRMVREMRMPVSVPCSDGATTHQARGSPTSSDRHVIAIPQQRTETILWGQFG